MTFKYAVIWVFDENRREYTQPTAEQRKAGIIYGERIWKGSWRAQYVVAETSRSWILQGGDKVPKRGANASRFSISGAGTTPTGRRSSARSTTSRRSASTLSATSPR